MDSSTRRPSWVFSSVSDSFVRPSAISASVRPTSRVAALMFRSAASSLAFSSSSSASWSVMALLDMPLARVSTRLRIFFVTS